MTDSTASAGTPTVSAAIDTAKADVATVVADAKTAVEDLVKFSRVPTEGHSRSIVSALHTLIDTLFGA